MIISIILDSILNMCKYFKCYSILHINLYIYKSFAISNRKYNQYNNIKNNTIQSILPDCSSSKFSGHLHSYPPSMLMHSPLRHVCGSAHSSISVQFDPLISSWYPIEKNAKKIIHLLLSFEVLKWKITILFTFITITTETTS